MSKTVESKRLMGESSLRAKSDSYKRALIDARNAKTRKQKKAPRDHSLPTHPDNLAHDL